MADYLGTSVSSAGDVNGDGFDDVIIGAPGDGPDKGASFVVFGQAGGFTAAVELDDLNGENGFKIIGEVSEDQSGKSVASAGDINGDGFDDLIIGAQLAHSNEFFSGATYVVFGRAEGFAAELQLSSLDGSNGFQISGEDRDDFSGYEVASVGDMNGDGFDDIVLTAPGAHGSINYSGAAYVVFGSSDGFPAELELTDLTGSDGFQITGEGIGRSVASAGDVNGDGLDDLIIGAPGDHPYGTDPSAAYVVFGSSGGFDANVNLADLDGTNGFGINPTAAYDHSGQSVSSAGDVNGDGFDDLLIGAYGVGPNGYNSGTTFVVFGQVGGFDAKIELSDLDGTDGFRINGEAANDRTGRAVASAGDVNGDGFDDVIIAANDAHPNGIFSGATYVVFGQASSFAAEVELSDLDGANGFQISGTEFDLIGVDVASAGDVNGDGFDDVIIGAPFGYANASFVVLGKAGGFAADISVADLNGANGFRINGEKFDRVIVGTNGADQLQGGREADDIRGEGGDDILSGSNGNDLLSGGDGNDSLDGGKNADTMLGGRGDDTYVVDDAGDIVSEDGGGGIDKVQSKITYQLGPGVNDLTLMGFFDIDGTGTSSDNTLVGSGGANTLDGRGGADEMAGRNGDDTYVVDHARDIVKERAAEGRDTVQSSISYKLGPHVNNLTLTGAADINGAGTDANNVLRGNAGRNMLNGNGGDDYIKGNAGNDKLSGGAGADTFVFGDTDGKDLLTDFEDGSDRIDVTTVDDVDSFGDLDITDTGDGVLIDYGNGTVQLGNVASATSITADDFVFA